MNRPDLYPGQHWGKSSMSLHREISFETEICNYLAGQGWLYAEDHAANYDRARASFPPDVLLLGKAACVEQAPA